MIKINLDKKLNSLGMLKSEFEDEYFIGLSSNELSIFKEKRPKGKTIYFLDIYSMNSPHPILRKYNTETTTIKDLIALYYKNNSDFREFINAFSKSLPKPYSGAQSFIKQILLLTPKELEMAKYAYDRITPSKAVVSILGKIFNYDRDREKIVKVIYKLDFRVCIYCNRNYISNFIEKATVKKRTTFTLDHFYQQDKYPLFTLSLYNLIPSCHVCNSLIKNKRKVHQYKNPYDENYNFHKDAKFTLMSKKCVELYSSDSECTKYIKDFYINEVYSTHEYDVKNFLKDRDVFTDKLIKKYAEISKTTELTVKKAVFGNSIFNNDLDQEPLSKLKSDLAKQIGLKGS